MSAVTSVTLLTMARDNFAEGSSTTKTRRRKDDNTSSEEILPDILTPATPATPATPKATKTPSFNTLQREASFRCPSKDGSTVPILSELAAPHIESFNSLFADSGLPIPHGHDERNVGLLGLAIKGIEDKVIFDGADGMHEQGAGNKLRSNAR